MSCQFFPSCSTIESRCATRGSLHDWIIEQHFLTHKPIYKCLDIVIVRKLPRRVMKPEGFPGHERQDRLPIHEISYRQRGHKGAKLKLDNKLLRPLGMGLRCRFGQWTLDRDLYSSIPSEEEHIPTAIGRANRSILAPSSTTPNHFYIRRV